METKGDRLRALRLKKNLTLDEVGKYIGKNRQAVYKYEKNIVTNIPSDVIERLSIVLDTTPAYILGWEVERVNNGYLVKENGNEYQAILNDISKEMTDEELIETIKYAKYLLQDKK